MLNEKLDLLALTLKKIRSSSPGELLPLTRKSRICFTIFGALLHHLRRPCFTISGDLFFLTDEVKLYVVAGSPFVCRVEIALNLKGIEYQTVEQDLKNKSSDLLNFNHVRKEVPVLVHNGNPISESLVIVEYIDDFWRKGFPILPHDPYEKSVARFWAKFIDSMLTLVNFTEDSLSNGSL